ncbi:MAG: DMT family transporter [Thermoplasmata archaeon]
MSSRAMDSRAAALSGRGPPAATGLFLVLLTAIISGISTFVNLYAVRGTNSDAFVTVRNCAVAVLLVPLFFATTRRGPKIHLRARDWGRLVAIGIVGGGIPFLLFFRGLELATAAGGGVSASFLYRTLFLMATVLGIVFLGERFRWRYVVAATLLLGGNLLLLSLTTPLWTNGSGYVLAATVLWAVEYTISKRTLRDLPSGTVSLGRMGFGAIFLLLYLGATSQFSAVGSLNGGQWEWVAISAALLSGFVVSWYAGLKRVDLGVATSVLVLGFPITWLLAVTIGGSASTVLEAVGAVTVAIGVIVATGRQTLRSAWEYARSTVLFRPSA